MHRACIDARAVQRHVHDQPRAAVLQQRQLAGQGELSGVTGPVQCFLCWGKCQHIESQRLEVVALQGLDVGDGRQHLARTFGAHGVLGKTALAQALARAQGAPLVRLQCFEGLDMAQAAYEWNYGRQLMAIRLHDGQPGTVKESDVFSREFLLERPLLQAISQDGPCVLLIDEIDRADEPFEAFLLEYLGEYQVTIPELGTIRAEAAPLTLLTSNRTRDLNDAVKRRCLYQWLDYPDRDRELAIVRSQVPQASAALTEQVTQFVSRLRNQPFANAFQRSPGIAESVEWAKALVALDTLVLDPEVIQDTAGILFKQREDVAALLPLLDQLLAPEAA